MSKTLNQNVTNSLFKSTKFSKKNLLYVTLISTTLMLGLLLLAPRLLDSQKDVEMLRHESKIFSRQQFLISICNDMGARCNKFPEQWDIERKLTTTEIDWCKKTYPSRLTKCTNLLNHMDALNEFAHIVNNYNS